MKRITILITLLLLVSSLAYSQMTWLRNEKMTKAIAVEKDQLILMDFWASWCGPCRKMDAEMWNTDEFSSLSENIVPFKIDIDSKKTLARRYNIRSIPHVIIATASGEIVWEKTGYSYANPYQEVLASLPTDLNGLNAKLISLSDEFNDEAYFAIAETYQELALETENDLRKGFLSLSDKYYNEITKSSEIQENLALAEMEMLLNDAYLGRYKRAIRKVDKIDVRQNNELADMKQYIKAYCFKCDGDEKAFSEAKALIKSDEYISQLEK